MAASVSRADLKGRLSPYLLNHYLALHVSIVSFVLGVGGMAGASLVGHSRQLGPYLVLHWMLWAASLLMTAVVYAGTTTGSVALPGAVPAVTDMVVPLLLGMSEFLLFAVLAPALVDLEPTERVGAWFVCLSLAGALSAIAIMRARHLLAADTFADDARAAILGYLQRLRVDLRGALAILGLGVLGGISQFAPFATSLAEPVSAYILGALTLLALSFALWGHSKTAKMWSDEIARSA